MSSLESLADNIRNLMVVLDVPLAQEMAIYSTKKEVYSNLSPLSAGKIAPFAESFMLLGVGDNFSLALGDGRIIVVSRVSERAALVVVTDQKIGTVLMKIRQVIDKYGREFDSVLKGSSVAAPQTRSTSKRTAQPAIHSEEKSTQRPQPTASTKSSRVLTIKAFTAPCLVDKKTLKDASGDDKKILSLCTGRLSIGEISKKTKLPPKVVIETVHRYSQQKALELREGKTAEA